MNVKDSGQSVSFLEFSREEKSDTFYPTVAFQTPSPPLPPPPAKAEWVSLFRAWKRC